MSTVAPGSIICIESSSFCVHWHIDMTTCSTILQKNMTEQWGTFICVRKYLVFSTVGPTVVLVTVIMNDMKLVRPLEY